MTGGERAELKKIVTSLHELSEFEHGDQPFSSAIFKDSLLAPCPECGYRYGSQWLRRELPAEVIAWVESL